ncbi:Hypothetical predicted protein [Mytilus galloprovincialis]|nr:Hypothetical predicted protein [Mytilus galloprovincialis]
MFNTYLTTSEVKSNLKKSINSVSTGPFALIYVLPLRGQTDEDRITIKEMIEVLGDEMYRSIIIVFTDSKISDVLNNCTLQEYLKEMPDYINDLIDRCEHKYIALSFDGHGNENNMIKQFSFLQKMPVSGSYYKCESYTQLRIGKHLVSPRYKPTKAHYIGLFIVGGTCVYNYLTFR